MHYQPIVRRWYFAEVVSFHDVRRRLLALFSLTGRYWGRTKQVDEELLKHELDLADLMSLLRTASVVRSYPLPDGGYSWIFSGATVDGHEGVGTVEAIGVQVRLLELQIRLVPEAPKPQRAA